MDSTQQTGFIHSVPVPLVYKKASKIARQVKEGKDSLKNLVYACREREVQKVYALVVETFKRNGILDDLIQKSQLLVKEPRLDVWLAKIIIWDLFWGKKTLKRGCKPIETVLKYEKVLRELSKDCEDFTQPVLKHDVLKPRYVRVNTLKITTEEAVNNFVEEGWRLVPFSNKSNYKDFQDCLVNLNPDEFIKDIHIPDLLIFPPKTQFHHHEAYKSGCIILQDKASCLPVHLLAPGPGSIVLDTCAAPGMKTTQLAALLQNEGTVYAVEVSTKREPILRQMVESAGATCVKTILKDVMEVTDQICPDVEYILVDPSCTGSGIIDRIEIEKLDLNEKMARLRKLCNFQAKLLRHTMKSFPKAKRIVYSTCSLNSEENEDVVRQVLETSREFKLVNARENLTSWNNKSSEVYPELGEMCIFATPTDDKTNGFFVAVFERMQKGERNPYLNYELCKLYDKQLRNTQDDIQHHKESEKNTKSENFHEESITLEQPIKINENRKKIKSSKKENENMDLSMENSCQFDNTVKTKEKKNKSHKEVEVVLENPIEECLTSKKKNKKKKLELEQVIIDQNVEENAAVCENSFTGKKEKKKHLKNEENGNKDHPLEITIELDSSFKEKRKKKGKNKELGKENENLDPENSLVSENTSEEKNVKKSEKGTLNESEKIDLSMENSACDNKLKKEKKKNKKINTDNVNSFSGNCIVETKAKKKKKHKDDELNEEQNEKTDISMENSVEFDNTLCQKKKRKKNKSDKLDREIENTESFLENSIQIENILGKKEKKNKKAHTEENRNPDVILEENIELENTSIKEKRKRKNIKLEETNANKESFNQSIDNSNTKENKKSDKKRKRKSETFVQSMCDTNDASDIPDIIKSKVKKVKKH